MTKARSVSVQVLASGSSGNCILIKSEGFNLLIDAGLSGRELVRRLECANLAPDEVSALVVTHEHQDHARGVGVFSRRYGVPVYMNSGTLRVLDVGKLPTVQTFETGDTLRFAHLTIHTYPVPHDAADPIGLRIENSAWRIGVALDMGYPTRLVKQRLAGVDLLILEFNHDVQMLRGCNRPWELKQRILSKRGHMSNDAALLLLCELMHARLQAVVLAHISREANDARFARGLVSDRLAALGRTDVRIYAGDQDQVGREIVLR
ncbi:MAG: MBL fold metallo-hydrolase [Candidatus Abyssubacteria bacterium]